MLSVQSQPKKLSRSKSLRGLVRQISGSLSSTLPHIRKKKPSIFLSLPLELISHIFTFLNLSDIFSVSSSCKEWNYLCQENTLWKQLSLRHFELNSNVETAPISDLKQSTESWQEYHHRRWKIVQGWKKKASLSIDTLVAHTASVNCVFFDDEFLVTGSSDKCISVWERIQIRRTYDHSILVRAHTASVQSLSVDDRRMVTGGLDNTIRLWDLPIQEQIIVTNKAHKYDVYCIQMKGNTIISAGSDSTVKIWRAQEDSECIESLIYPSPVTGLAFTDNQLVTGCADAHMRMWDLNTGQNMLTWIAHEEGIRCIQRVDNALITGSSDHTMRLWDLRCKISAKNSTQLQKKGSVCTMTGHSGAIRCLQLVGSSLISGAADRKIKLWDLRALCEDSLLSPPDKKQSVTLMTGPTGAIPTCLYWSCETLVCGSTDSTVRVIENPASFPQ